MNYAIYRYTLPFYSPFATREGLLLHIEGQGWGEIAPFPGRNKESLEEAYAQLLAILQGQKVEKLFPSVAFGLDAACRKSALEKIPACVLLTGSPDAILRRAESALEEGYTTAKVKISGMGFDDARSLLLFLQTQFDLRVDANRSFSFELAVKLFEDCFCSYIEEPTYELSKLEHFPYPFALDESLLELADLPKTSSLCALVLKPTTIGGYEQCSRFAKRGVEVVFSSACESGVGIHNIATLASAFPLAPIGVDTYSYLKQDVLQAPLKVSDGHLRLPSEITVNTDLLKLLAHG